jgi:choline dehydrogenase-like flavoprotein
VAAAGWLVTQAPAEDLAGVEQLLDLLALSGFRTLPAGARAAVLKGLAKASADAATGLEDLQKLTVMLFYALPDRTGGNPSWRALGYPGPPEVAAPPARNLEPTAVADDTALEADVCIVGSGAGGGVIAGILSDAGLDVVVLEAGGDPQEGDFPRHELEGMTRLYWRGGLTATEERNVTVLAGATLGGGTTVNWTNCVQPPDRVRKVWADEHGLTGLDTAAFDEHLDTVMGNIGATQEASDRNGPNEALRAAADAAGWSWKAAHRNTDPASYDPVTAGHMGYGDRSGSKRGTLQTYLAAAVRAGARVITSARADRVLVEAGRAVGVAATVTRPDGTTTPLTVRARTVVAAAGALETPALLLRSGVGGPAVGRHLRLHPVAALVGLYDDDQRAWWGPPQSVIVDEFADGDEGFGFLLECPHYGAGLSSAMIPWRSGRDHKLLMGKLGNASTFIGLVRDRGAGRVTIDAQGDAVVAYPLADALDRAHLMRALDVMAEAHVAAGARAIVDLAPGRSLWTRGGDLAAYTERLRGIPNGAGGRALFSAHQMGTARMGADAATSVADPEGQLHDVPGVWIGDTSAFPTAVGSNPMVTCMALARRTAQAILAARP